MEHQREVLDIERIHDRDVGHELGEAVHAARVERMDTLMGGADGVGGEEFALLEILEILERTDVVGVGTGHIGDVPLAVIGHIDIQGRVIGVQASDPSFAVGSVEVADDTAVVRDQVAPVPERIEELVDLTLDHGAVTTVAETLDGTVFVVAVPDVQAVTIRTLRTVRITHIGRGGTEADHATALVVIL